MQAGKQERPFIHYLAIYGCVSTGMIYASIGVIAILSFLRVKQGGADESSLLVYLDQFVAGKILIWIILLGTLSYITWRIYETIRDPYRYGKEAKGIATRTGIALSTVADALIAYSAVLALLGTGKMREDGQPEAERQMAGNMLQESWGDSVITSIGVIICITAIVQLVYGITKGYRERLGIDHLERWKRNVIHYLAWIGYGARGIILGIIGFFFIKAGISGNAQHIVNTDKAFDFIGDHVGHVYFILVAIGTICYGFFMFVFGVYYDTDRD